MSVNNIIPRNEYVGNGAATVFSYTFRILDAAHIVVLVDGVLKVLNTDYTVSGVGIVTGGSVTFGTAPANNTSIIILRNTPVEQITTWTNNEPFDAVVIEKAYDKLTMIVQEIREILQRVPVMLQKTLLKNITLPLPGAGNLIRWNSAGTDLDLVSANSLPTSPTLAFGTDGLAGNAVQAVITHNLNSATARGFYTANWNTSIFVLSQTANTITIAFSDPTPAAGGTLVWLVQKV